MECISSKNLGGQKRVDEIKTVFIYSRTFSLCEGKQSILLQKNDFPSDKIAQKICSKQENADCPPVHAGKQIRPA